MQFVIDAGILPSSNPIESLLKSAIQGFLNIKLTCSSTFFLFRKATL